MNNDTTPPPPELQPNDLPDYYLGFLIVHDELSDNSCKWVVYDGTSRVRCPSRPAAVNYITDRYNHRNNANVSSRIIDARISLNHAINQLDAAANSCTGLEQLHLALLAVRLKPVLVDIDNITIN